MYPPTGNQYPPPPPMPPSAPPVYQHPPPSIPVAPPPQHQYQFQPNNINPSAYTGKWSSGLCACCSDCSSCCMTFFCPCVTFGQVAEIVDKGSIPRVVSSAIYCLICHFTGCVCVYAYNYRTRLRQQYRLPETPCADFLVHCCCPCCALAQEYRHLTSLGFELSLGWSGNMEKQNQGVTNSPIVPPGMNR